MTLGGTHNLTFIGSATHGGGSCQISITYDEAPTKSSTWKVIHSIEGGCPIKNTAGNNGDDANKVNPDVYEFTIPSSLPTGTAVLAWTWFNKIGNREMYMNCAPITISGGSAKRSMEDEELMRRNYTQFVERDTAAYNALPDMFIANIPVEKCKTQDSMDLKFPNPGDSLELFGTATMTPVTATGPSCGAAFAGATGAASAGSGSGSSAITSAAASKATSAGQGGVFVTVATSASAPVATSAAPVASSVAKSSAVATSAAPVASPVASSSAVASQATPVASSAAPASTGTGSAIAAGTACTTEGMFNCISGTSFQQCASGTWSVVQSVAAGTTCTGGESMAMGISAIATKPKRRVRFANPHVRRHLQVSF